MALPTFPDNAWGAPETTLAEGPEEPSVETALLKEKIIKDILSLRDGLRGMIVRVSEAERDTEKLGRDNEMLGVYIDNLLVTRGAWFSISH
jgi:hypothetical protein